MGSTLIDGRLGWAAIRSAIALPPLTRAADATLVLELGQRSVGWALAGQRMERPGPALDLTGATVQLRALPMPEAHGVLEQLRLQRLSLAEARDAGLIVFGSSFFLVDGVVGSPATAGQVSFTLPAAKLDGEGRFFARPEVTTAGGLLLVPRLLKFSLIGGGY